MLKQEIRYSIVCDDCGGLITTERFKTKEEAENYFFLGWGCGVIRSMLIRFMHTTNSIGDEQ